MLKIENAEVIGWWAAIRGMRNPLESWNKSDTVYGTYWGEVDGHKCFDDDGFTLGQNDYGLMMRLRNAGTDHRKFMRMIVVYVDITAPLYWWKEFDTYKVGTVANSCSTMHKIHAKEFTLGDFSCEHLNKNSLRTLEYTLEDLNHWGDIYINGGTDDNYDGTFTVYEPKDKNAWWQMIQLLPSSYNQRRTVMLNYEVLANIYKSRKNHKLDEWHTFCDWIASLPYSEIITGGKENACNCKN